MLGDHESMRYEVSFVSFVAYLVLCRVFVLVVPRRL